MEFLQFSRANGQKTETRITLRKSIRWVIYIFLWIISAMCTFSSGLMSVSAKNIKAEIGLMDLDYGCLSSMHSIGKVLGAFLFFSLVNVVNRKYIVIFCAIVKGATVIPFALTRNGNALLVIRLISGFAHILPGLYFGSWIGNFATGNNKTAWTRGFSFSSPGGRCLGYYWDLYATSARWKMGLLVNGGVLIFSAFVILFVPSIYFSSKLVAMKEGGFQYLRPSQREEMSVYKVRYSAIDERDANYCRKYSKVFSNPIFVLLVLAKSGVNVIFTVFRFFMPKYIVETLGAGDVDKALRTHTYAAIIFFSPYLGSLISFIFVKAVGGYEKKKAFLVVLLLQFLLAAVCIPLPLIMDWRFYMVNALIYHLLSSAILPTYNGIIGACVEKKYRAGALNISKYFTSGVFSAPAPSIYGLMSDHWKEYDSHFSMKVFCSLPVFGLILVSICCSLRYAQSKDSNEPFVDKNDKVPIEKPRFDLHDNPVPIEHQPEPNKQGQQMKEVV